jgi:hypothetical protein
MDRANSEYQSRPPHFELSEKAGGSPTMDEHQGTNEPDVSDTANGHDDANEDKDRDNESDESVGEGDPAFDLQPDAPRKKKKKRKPKSKRGLVSKF